MTDPDLAAPESTRTTLSLSFALAIALAALVACSGSGGRPTGTIVDVSDTSSAAAVASRAGDNRLDHDRLSPVVSVDLTGLPAAVRELVIDADGTLHDAVSLLAITSDGVTVQVQAPDDGLADALDGLGAGESLTVHRNSDRTLADIDAGNERSRAWDCPELDPSDDESMAPTVSDGVVVIVRAGTPVHLGLEVEIQPFNGFPASSGGGSVYATADGEPVTGRLGTPDEFDAIARGWTTEPGETPRMLLDVHTGACAATGTDGVHTLTGRVLLLSDDGEQHQSSHTLGVVQLLPVFDTE